MTRPEVARTAIPAFIVGLVVGGCAVWLLAATGSLERPIGTTHAAQPTVAAEPPPDSSYDPETVEIEYEVVTDGMSVTHLSYVDVVNGAPAMVESLGTPPPFRYAFRLPKQSAVDLVSLSVTGMGAATSTTTMCTLKVNGEVVARQTADGTYGLVSCQVPPSG